MIGTVINAVTIVVMSFVGMAIGTKLKLEIKEKLMNALGLAVILIGLSMALKMENFLIVTASMVTGTAIGEITGIESYLERTGKRLEEKFKGSKIAEGFVTSTLLYCVGSMAIVGPIQEGLTGDYSILLAKSMLDGVASVFLASTMGVGVAFSSLSVLLYQGTFTFLASLISPYMTPHVINELTATGGLLIFAIGINLTGLRKIEVGNMLPALLIAPILATYF
jgi:hypothetical protein